MLLIWVGIRNFQLSFVQIVTEYVFLGGGGGGGEAVSTLQTFVWILNHVSSRAHKSIKLGQMTTFDAVFHVVAWLKF